MAQEISMPGRASAVLTTGEVAGAAASVSQFYNGEIWVDFDFTLGSLTNVIVKFYASMDGTTYDLIENDGGSMTKTLTANSTAAYPVPQLKGWRFFRVSVQGTGTVTSSLCAFTYRGLRKGSLL